MGDQPGADGNFAAQTICKLLRLTIPLQRLPTLIRDRGSKI